MKIENKISYVTYQTFPAKTANSLQTISNIKYLNRNGFNVELIFPLRSSDSSNDLKKIKNFYNLDEDITIRGLKHNLPFGKFKYFERLLFLISHFIWSKNTTKTLQMELNQPKSYFTRSDWIFYFLSRQRIPVVYECHQFTKFRKIIINKSLKSKKSKVIFLNEYLKEDYEEKYQLNDNSIVLHNGVDLEYFKNSEKNINELIFVGNLKRFNKKRDIHFLLRAIKELDSRYTLKIIGAKESEFNELQNDIDKLQISDRVAVLGYLNHKETVQELVKSGIGILINTDLNIHSTRYTSPLKYFEYLAAGLKILAVDYEAHRKLPFAENISFFKNSDIESFQEALENLNLKGSLEESNNRKISLDTRAKLIIENLP